MTLNETLVPTYLQMLAALSAWLGKAADQLPDDKAAAIMNARIAPDMFPLFTQICFTCVQAQEGISRLRQDDLPPATAALLDEGRGAGSGSQTIADAQARIADTLRIVEAAAADMPDLSPDTPVAHALPNGMIFDLTAAQYVRDWAIPQFYFHLMAAYAILRAQGVNLGKADYVAHMFGFLRPGTMPEPG
ncbi:DUF1993 domain-containing protein [Blastomonas aquatica]|uniref:DUF1993 domain-containing protein n=1 Tax=Blastomonas aquatica TaxID=1510276 RepID=A0ABQ1JDU9_9SPHN|nr:DUF1993 domain-containing protein [Blastomonas aquatica]GGB63713.1 hypothetical protein GCM10010833_18380 [Blastomonas aquatica]